MFLIKRDDHYGREAEALATFVDDLVAGREPTATVEEPLADVVRLLHAELHPVQPPVAFVDGLRARLVALAEQRAPASAIAEPPVVLWRQPRFIIGAAGVVSAAAVLAFVARSRIQAAKAA
ncbi:MAG TPA: hypothetical protein VFC93_16130 [Chloroflexota bacterium]|nr:hypothetical protein [Chloroflexota bacterium]